MADAPNANPKEKNKNNTNIVVIGMFSFLITVVIAGTFLIITFRAGNASSQSVHERVAAERSGVAETIGPLVPLGNEIIVNLQSQDGMPHYLKVNVTLETEENEKVKEEVAKRVPQVRDLLISILRSKTKEKIDEKEGKDEIRSEIINGINRFLITGKVRNVYFEDFMVQ